MGNNNSQQKENKELDEFHLKIKELYLKNFSNKKELTIDDVNKLFPNRKLFCEKFHRWMCALSYRKSANRESLIFACEIFLLDSEKIVKEIYSNHSYNYLELFFHMILAKDPRKLPPITFNDLETFIDCFLNFLLGDRDYSFTKKNFMNMFKNQFDFENKIYIYPVVKFLKDKLPTSVYFLKKNFENLLFLNKEIEFPKYDQSDILNDEILIILGLTNNKILNYSKMNLLYSSTKSGSSFNRLAHSIKGYSAPVLILIKNKYNTIKSLNNSDIFGAFVDCTWEDNLGYFGNSEAYLFRISNSFDTFFTFNGKGGKDYIYLNTKNIKNSKYKKGLGFGGANYEDYRIWLDSELLQKSSICDYGKTYANGVISDSSDTYLKIKNIEIWGFPDLETEAKQEEFRRLEHNLAMNNRKIDKKEFLGIGNQFLLEKQNKFREQLNIDLDFEKEHDKKN